jgi:hypothetical protein
MAQLGEDTRAGLAKILPSFATTTNPIDITAALLSNSGLFGQILPVLAKDSAADAFLIGIPVAGQGYDVDGFAADSEVFARRTGKPLVTAIRSPRSRPSSRPRGWRCLRPRARRSPRSTSTCRICRCSGAGPAPPAAMPARRAPRGGLRALNEADSLALISRYGVPVVRHRLCRSAEEAVAALREIGAPGVVKGCSSAVAHKSEWGLVKLDVRRGSGARPVRRFDRTLRLAGAPFDGIIVAETVRGRRELMIGAHVDPVFGPVVVVGDGGKYVETMPDLRLLLPPFDELDVVRALSRLRIAPLLPGVRGDPPLASETFAEVAVAVARMMDPRCEVVSVDLNPVMVGAPASPARSSPTRWSRSRSCRRRLVSPGDEIGAAARSRGTGASAFSL